MSYITRFGGYTPEDDLQDFDWSVMLDADMTATARGLTLDFVDSDKEDYVNKSLFLFSNIIPEVGKYIIALLSRGAPGDVVTVAIDGLLAEPVYNDNRVAIYAADAASMYDGDLEIQFEGNASACYVAVWRIRGLDDLTASGTEYGTFGTPVEMPVDTLAVVMGLVRQGNPQATDISWSGLVEDDDMAVQNNLRACAGHIRKLTTESTIFVDAAQDVDGADINYIVASWNTDLPYFESGSGTLIEKQVTDDFAYLAWDQISQVDDVEILALLRPIAQSDNFHMGVFARGSGADGTGEGYMAFLSQSVASAMDEFVVGKCIAGAFYNVATVSYAWALDTNYWIRFRLRGTLIKARVWEDGTTEPTTWNIDGTDTSIQTTGKVGIYNRYIDSSAEFGYFEAKELYAEWPSDVPNNWTVDIAGGPQPNKISFQPDVGPTIDRRRASTVNRGYDVQVPGLDRDEYTAFVEFYHTTLEEGTLPFTAIDPFTCVEQSFKFMSGGNDIAYRESVMRSPGASYTDGIYMIEFMVIRVD